MMLAVIQSRYVSIGVLHELSGTKLKGSEEIARRASSMLEERLQHRETDLLRDALALE